jgi:hypothetical protein
MVHKVKKTKAVTLGFGRPKLKVVIKPTTARAKTMEWKIHRKGKVFTAKRKKMTWGVKGKTQHRPDVGLLGRGKKIIKISRKGALKKHGYGIHFSEEQRRRALRSAEKEFGAPSVFKMLQAQTVFRKHTDGALPKFVADREYVKKNLMTGAEKLAMTEPARKEWMSMSPEARAKAMPERK